MICPRCDGHGGDLKCCERNRFSPPKNQECCGSPEMDPCELCAGSGEVAEEVALEYVLT